MRLATVRALRVSTTATSSKVTTIKAKKKGAVAT
jgi:hypothetical protein